MAENHKRLSKDTLEIVKEKARDAKDKAMEWGSVAADKAGDTLQDLGKELSKVVRRYPLQSVMVGMAIGFFLARPHRK